jgi:outer membrane protein TolC
MMASLVAAGCHSQQEVTPETAAQLKVGYPCAAPAYTAPTVCGPAALTSPSPNPSPSTPLPQGEKGAKADNGSAIRPVAAWQTDEPKTLPPAAVGAPVDPPPDGPAPVALGLVEAIETGLTQNPDLATLRGTVNVGEAVLGVAQTYPFNPTVQTRNLPYSKNQNGTYANTYTYVLVWQQFELCHQRRFRTENAAAAIDSMRWNVQQAELQNIALTEQLYFAALYQRGLRDLALRIARLNDEMLDVTQKRSKAKTSGADVAIVRIDTRAAHQQARLAEVAYNNAVLALRRQLNLPPDVPLQLLGDLADFEWHSASGAELCQLLGEGSEFNPTMTRDGLVTQLAARRPDVLAARATSQAARANVSLARASQVPNLWLGPFWSLDGEAITNLGFQAQIDIPVINTGRPLVRQRQAEMRQQLNTADQLELRARLEARTALDRYEQALALWTQLRAEGGQRPDELQQLEAEYAKSEIDFLRIFQARNSLLLYERARLDSLNEVALAASALTAASGLPPAALVSRKAP